MKAPQQDTIFDVMPSVAVLGTTGTGEPTVPHISAAAPTKAANQNSSVVTVAVIGATGTGKSTFTHLLTSNEHIHVNHHPEFESFDIQTARYVDEKTDHSVMVIDTPGFDNSREGVTGTDILEKVVSFLAPEEGESRKLKGIIYMHRISDTRVRDVSHKKLRMLRLLCGDANLKNVRIVTTNWDRVSEEEGNRREKLLRSGPFKALIDAGASMLHHLNTVESAREIMSGFIGLEPVSVRIQDDLETGMTIEGTSTGTIPIAEMQKKHEKELVELKEMEAATIANDLTLRAEFAEERQALEQELALAKEDRERLARELDELRQLYEQIVEQPADLIKAGKQMEDEPRKKDCLMQQSAAEHQKQLVEAKTNKPASKTKTGVARLKKPKLGIDRTARMLALAIVAARSTSSFQRNGRPVSEGSSRHEHS